MKHTGELHKEFEFYLPDLDNPVLVESNGDGVRIRAAHANVSEARKRGFIRELAMEGFIPDHYQWFSDPCGGGYSVTWTVDCSWLVVSPAVIRGSRRFMARLFAGAAALWLAAMTIAIVHGNALRSPRAGQNPSRSDGRSRAAFKPG